MRTEHRGHPYAAEQLRARQLSERIGLYMSMLRDVGFSHEEAIGFIAGVAWEIGQSQDDTWASPHSAKETVERLLMGRAAKDWSMDLLVAALDNISEVI